MSLDEENDCKLTFARIWPDEADGIMLGLKKFKRSSNVLLPKQWEAAGTTAAHEFMELHASTFVTHGVTPSFMRSAMQLCAQTSAASVAEHCQGACGWSKVGCIETEKRSRLLTHRTDKLVNINGWQWALQEDTKPQNQPRTTELFEALDELVSEKQTVALEIGNKEGEDDTIGGSADAPEGDGNDDHDDNEDNEGDNEEQDETNNTCEGDVEEDVEEEYNTPAESDAAVYDSDGPACADLPVRSAIKCNQALELALPGIVDFRNCDFEVTRKLAFA